LPLSKVVDTSSGGTPRRTNQSYYSGDIPWLKSGEMNDSLISQAEEFITEEGLNNSSAKIFPKGTLLVAMYGATAGKTGILDIDASTNQAVCAVTPKDKSTNRDFLFWFFRANRFYFIDISRGGAQPNISQSVIGNTDFPIVEDKLQKNIALFLSNLEQTKEADYSLIPLDLCQPVKLAFDYLSCLQKLEYENKNQINIVSKLKQAILQEAIAGQLTAEWRTENPMQKGNPETDAIALLAKIKGFWEEHKTRYQKLSFKGYKNGQTIDKSEVDSSWINTNIDSIGIVKVGSTPSRTNPKYWNGRINWISSGEVANNIITHSNECITDIALKEASLYPCPAGTVLVAMIGQGKTRGQSSILQIESTTNQNVAAIIIDHGYINSKYLWYFFLSRYLKTRQIATGGNQPALNSVKIGCISFPLPPLAEQKAIVEKVDKLMNIIDQLEQQIKHRKQLAEDLMQTVLREAFE
jgi:type I restriction enzyme S subunit